MSGRATNSNDTQPSNKQMEALSFEKMQLEVEKLKVDIKHGTYSAWRSPGTWFGIVAAVVAIAGVFMQWKVLNLDLRQAKAELTESKNERQQAIADGNRIREENQSLLETKEQLLATIKQVKEPTAIGPEADKVNVTLINKNTTAIVVTLIRDDVPRATVTIPSNDQTTFKADKNVPYNFVIIPIDQPTSAYRMGILRFTKNESLTIGDVTRRGRR